MADGADQEHPEAISIAGYDFLANAVEVARLWVEDEGPATCLIQPERLAEPEMFGMLMVDAVRHGARAFAAAHGLSEDEARARIWHGLDMERGREATGMVTLQDYERGE